MTTTDPQAEAMLTVAELAAQTGMHPKTIYLHAKAGTIPGIKIAGAWRFYLSEVVDAARPKKVDLWEQPVRATRRKVQS